MKTRPKHELPIVPTANLVDIAILLIIFYMACSNFVSQQGGTIKLPQSPDIDKLSEPLVLVAIDDTGAIRVQGKPVATPLEVQGMVASLVQGQTVDEKRRVMLRCDSDVLQSVFAPVMDAIVEGGGIITAVGEKPPAK